jgi:hypothetical protein
MVIFRSPEGKPGYHQAEGVDAAMRFAEMLRNQQQVTDARIFRMDEVPIEFKTYYRVELAGRGNIAAPGDSVAAAPKTETAEVPADEGSAEDAPIEEGAEAADAVSPLPAAEAVSPLPAASAEAGAKGSGRHGIFARG